MDSLLKNSQVLLSITPLKVLSKDFWYIFRTSACTRKSISRGLHQSCLWQSQSLMSWDSDILARVFLTRRAVRREAGLWAQHSIISFPICRRHCREKGRESPTGVSARGHCSCWQCWKTEGKRSFLRAVQTLTSITHEHHLNCPDQPNMFQINVDFHKCIFGNTQALCSNKLTSYCWNAWGGITKDFKQLIKSSSSRASPILDTCECQTLSATTKKPLPELILLPPVFPAPVWRLTGDLARERMRQVSFG